MDEKRRLQRKRKSFGYMCETCNKKFDYLVNLVEHTRLHEEKFCCDDCDAVFNSLDRVETHRKFVHKPYRAYDCKLCGKRFGNIIAFHQHLSMHAYQAYHANNHASSSDE